MIFPRSWLIRIAKKRSAWQIVTHICRIPNDISDTKVNLSPVSIDLKIKASEEAKKVLPETGINVLPSDTKTNIIKPLVSRPPISILPDDPEEKQKSVINKVQKQFPYLSSKYSNKNHDYFDFNSSVSCPIWNKDHKKENIIYGPVQKDTSDYCE